ncbi:MAG: lipid-binding SYLF domain-containing protein [Pseudomonadota bacterium]
MLVIFLQFVTNFNLYAQDAQNAYTQQDDLNQKTREARRLIRESEDVLQELIKYSKQGPYILNHVRAAKAVVIIPNLYKIGFLFGVEAGSGVMMARADNGVWSYPAFVKIKSGSFGFQVGYQESQLLLLVLTQKGLSSLLNQPVTLGGEISAAAGPIGEGYQAATTTQLGADVLSYMSASGAFIGAALEGSLLTPDDKLTNIYYVDQDANRKTVILDGLYANANADRLREMVQDFSDKIIDIDDIQ